MRTREIVEIATGFGWIKLAFPQLALPVGKRALMTLKAAARLMCALETDGIDNVLNDNEHDYLAYVSTSENL